MTAYRWVGWIDAAAGETCKGCGLTATVHSETGLCMDCTEAREAEAVCPGYEYTGEPVCGDPDCAPCMQRRREDSDDAADAASHDAGAR